MQPPKATLPSKAMSGSMVPFPAARDSIDVPVLPPRACRCPWSVLLLRVVMVSVACSAAECCVDVCFCAAMGDHADTGDHVDVTSPRCHQKPCGSP